MLKVIDYFKTLGVDSNTTATILITIFIFSFGLLLSWLARQLKNIKERNSYKKSLVLILEDFGKACEKQNKVVSKSLTTVGLKGNKNFVIKYVPIGTLDYLNKLDFNIFLQNFEPLLFKRLFSKSISKLFELIAQVKIQNESAREFMKEFSEKYAGYEKEYRENLGELKKIHDSLGAQLDGKVLHKDDGGELLQQYFKIFSDWFKNGSSRTLEDTYSQIVLRTIERLKEIAPHSIILSINDHALKCDLAYENIANIDKMLAEKFGDFAHFHRRASKLIPVIIKHIK